MQVHAVLVAVCTETEVAVLAPADVVGEVTVFVSIDDDIGMWDHLKKLLILLKEGTREIEISPILQWIPIISPPEAFFTDDPLALWWIDRDECFTCHIILSPVKIAHVDTRESPLEPRIRTQAWRRNRILLPIDHGGDFVEKSHISVSNLEWGAGDGADSLHGEKYRS